MTCVAEELAFRGCLAAAPGDLAARLAYADWLEDTGRTIAAAWVREEGVLPPSVTAIRGNGYGSGYGSGNGNGDGSGNGYGSGDGNGNGDGNGYGSGYGSGNGNGNGDGNGNGYGSGDGNGNGNGYGSGDGNGNGYGNGYGYGNGDGSGNGYGGPKRKFKPTIQHEEVLMPAPGDYVVVRSRDQGCVCGEYVSHHGREVVLRKARQIFSWTGERLTLVDFASRPGECRLSQEAPGELTMLEACGIISTTPEVEQFLRSHPGE